MHKAIVFLVSIDTWTIMRPEFGLAVMSKVMKKTASDSHYSRWITFYPL